MLCEKCKKNAAVVHFIKVINGEKTQICLCEDCMKDVTKNPLDLLNIGNDSEKFKNIIDEIFNIKDTTKEIKIDVVCKNCKTRFSDFKDTGLLGCPECYENFSELLKPVLKKTQEDIIYKGKIPEKDKDYVSDKKALDNLEINLIKAINNEEYELAAVFRDQINEIRNEIKGE